LLTIASSDASTMAAEQRPRLLRILVDGHVAREALAADEAAVFQRTLES
jgi:hypothetical protein